MYCHSNQYVIYLSDFFLADWAITFLFTALGRIQEIGPQQKTRGENRTAHR